MACEDRSGQTLGAVMVIGGTGFLGHHIVDLLLQRYPNSAISVADRSVNRNRRPPADGVRYFQLDITQAAAVSALFNNVHPDVVIHTASPLPQLDISPTRDVYDKVNVGGTQTIIAACHQYHVKALVYCSSASVVCDHTSDVVNADEGRPRVRGRHQPEYYAESKCQAEDLVIAANGTQYPLRTAVIRPSAIFGEGDLMTVPRLIDIYRQRRMYFQVGQNRNLFDFTYVQNVAHGHLLAAERLLACATSDGDAVKDDVGGQCFFITNGSPVFFWDFARTVWVQAGCRYDMRRVWVLPRFVAMILAFLSEVFFALIGKPATFNRQRVSFSCMTRYYNISKAKDRLGYEPLVALDEGIRRSVKWFLEQEAEKASKPEPFVK
ncbi:sterol-4-alpha-carboxylate 3-dehydrogenase [Nemania sp. NC0429]|nr:sterol-4-alpha-carboxylate 3-dehydrogenase [Nemania sp. NC0429]